jgi:hypothetical protein
MHQDDVRDRDPGARYARLAAPHSWRRFDMVLRIKIGLREIGLHSLLQRLESSHNP